MAAEIEIELGGPDPFPNEEVADCPASSDAPSWGYLCTRDAGHEPPHVAMADVVVAVWPPYRELGFDDPPAADS